MTAAEYIMDQLRRMAADPKLMSESDPRLALGMLAAGMALILERLPEKKP